MLRIIQNLKILIYMKKYLLMMSFTMIASLFLFTSCEKEDMDDDEYEDVFEMNVKDEIALQNELAIDLKMQY